MSVAERVLEDTYAPMASGDALALSPEERRELAECEAVIKEGLETFYEVGKALLRIRDGGLYRGQFLTFEDYCRGRWGWGRWNVNHLIRAAKVVDSLGDMSPKPDNARQAAELAPLDAEAQKAVWQIALKTAPEKDGRPVVTAAHIRSVTEVLTEVVRTGGLDDGSGETKPIGVLIDAAVTMFYCTALLV